MHKNDFRCAKIKKRHDKYWEPVNACHRPLQGKAGSVRSKKPFCGEKNAPNSSAKCIAVVKTTQNGKKQCLKSRLPIHLVKKLLQFHVIQDRYLLLAGICVPFTAVGTLEKGESVDSEGTTEPFPSAVLYSDAAPFNMVRMLEGSHERTFTLAFAHSSLRWARAASCSSFMSKKDTLR